MTHCDIQVVMYGDKIMSQPVASSNTIDINALHLLLKTFRYTKFPPHHIWILLFPSLLSLSHSLSSFSLSYHFSLRLFLLSHTLSLFLSFDAGTDLDMKKGAWQTRDRSCRQVTSPQSKQTSVRKPYKKPRQVTVIKETQEADSEAPTTIIWEMSASFM